ncbi:MAG: AraC family transcriptional regulator [Ruthenibacterium sp.]
MGYEAVQLTCPFAVDALITVHYFEYSSNYYFEGETHDFWEFLYVDKGEIDVRAADKEYHLQKGQIIFHAPDEFHSLRANGVVAPNLVVASFACHSAAMQFFTGKVLNAGDAERALLACIVEEAESAFTTPLDDPTTLQLERSATASFGAEQMIRNSIEQLLICFVRRDADDAARVRPTSLIHERSQQEFIERVSAYLEENIAKRLTLSDICRDNLVGRSYLQKIFREKTGGGAMEYFGTLKVEGAKRMIREGSHNFTEIASLLGYNSIHYFSRHFKKVTGMTPSEYASSVKVLSSKTRTSAN